MSQNAMQALQQRLGAGADELAFLEFVDDDTLAIVSDAAGRELDARHDALTTAITEGVSALPGMLGSLARRVLA
ncbi:hypothetical protein [Spectribacter hydrogenoxidans]|uniref:Uncharacterized protein n=1 Tax=Spectribacter hydrogenoxidans TaxID=3075608 RepID=A0ABU3BYX4_9GAMM|nr:hypothetical protein [Salinisphaera sp. W335]MDT0634503.1 hypothetical protein [Salinisphaera sp. W335]